MKTIFGWLNGPWVWLTIIGALVVLLLGQQVQVSNAKARVSRAELSTEAVKRERAEADTTRALAALTELQRLVGLVADHAKKQQELSNDLATKTAALATADARYRALDQRMRNTAAALGAALDRADAEARAAAGQREGDRSDTFNSVAADGIRLLGQSGEVVRACRSDLARRDAEVEALTRALANDRALLDGAAGEGSATLLPDSPIRLKSWSEQGQGGSESGSASVSR